MALAYPAPQQQRAALLTPGSGSGAGGAAPLPPHPLGLQGLGRQEGITAQPSPLKRLMI